MSIKKAVMLWAAGTLTFAISGCETPMKRVGQSANVQFGVVSHAEQVPLNSNVAKGALIGGTLGVIAGRGSSAGNAIKGATLGGAATAVGEGNRTGMAYTVAMLDGSSTRIVTDQREIRAGDCVAIERAGDMANIRRAATSYCNPANAQAVESVQPTIRTAAAECLSAKRELADAETDAAADLATRKIELLCDG